MNARIDKKGTDGVGLYSRIGLGMVGSAKDLCGQPGAPCAGRYEQTKAGSPGY